MNDTKLYDRIFGPDSVGGTAEERAANSSRRFVRSQLQIAEDSPKATGHRLTAHEVLEAFGFDVLRKAAEDGACPIVKKADEPARTLRNRRLELNLTLPRVANSAGVSVVDVERAETAGELSPFRVIQNIAQVLALDERTLGFVPGARGDPTLGVRLREMALARDAKRFSESEVVGLAEAAWVIARQHDLLHINGEQGGRASSFVQSRDYRYPAYQKGYDLAILTRNKLSLPIDEPVESLKTLIEVVLGIPVVQLSLGEKFAGATVANGPVRGIVVNERGANANVWVRRMTLAHEIAHLLWDPDERLDKLRVDNYTDVEGYGAHQTDVVEIRANAFAVAFLAPPSGVRKIMDATNDKGSGLAAVMTKYGISATAAKYHIKNMTGIDVSDLPNSTLPAPSDEWIARENLAVDFFKPISTPISRRGKIALLIAKAFKAGKISSDTASCCLRCKTAEFEENVDLIIATQGGRSDARAPRSVPMTY